MAITYLLRLIGYHRDFMMLSANNKYVGTLYFQLRRHSTHSRANGGPKNEIWNRQTMIFNYAHQTSANYIIIIAQEKEM